MASSVAKPSDEVAADAVLRAEPAHPGCRAAASSSRPRSIISASIRTAASASMSAPRPAASPRSCSRAARGASTRSMSGAASCTRACAARPEVVVARSDRHPQARSRAAAGAAGFRHRRRELHLAQAGAAGRARAGAAAGAARRADQAAIRGRPAALKKGIVRDPAVHAAVCDDIAAFVTSLGWTVAGIIPSPIAGGDGNREFLIAAHRATERACRPFSRHARPLWCRAMTAPGTITDGRVRGAGRARRLARRDRRDGQARAGRSR